RELRRDPRDELRLRETACGVEAQFVNLLLNAFDRRNLTGAAAVACARPRQSDERLVNRLPFDLGTLAAEDFVDLQRRVEVRVERAVQEGAVGTLDGRLREGHARPDSAPPRFARGRGDDAAAAGTAADNEGTAGELGTPCALDGNEERIQIDVKHHSRIQGLL